MRPKRVVLDIRSNGNTGVARYGRCLASHSAVLFEDHGIGLKVILPADHRPGPDYQGLSNEVFEPAPIGFRWRDDWLLWFLQQNHVDLYVSTNYLIDDRLRIPFAFTIHDVLRLRGWSVSDSDFQAQYGSRELDRIHTFVTDRGWKSDRSAGIFGVMFRRVSLDLSTRAKRVLTVSRTSADGIRRELNVPEESLRVVPSAVSHTIVAGARRAGSRRGDQFLTIGSQHPHKRTEWLLDTFETWGRKHGCRLMVVGRKPFGWHDRRRSCWIGYVDDEELGRLYAESVAYISASTEEGYGLPPVEALTCGSQAVVTDIAAHREVLREHASYFGINDATSLYDQLDHAISAQSSRAPYVGDTWSDNAQTFVAGIVEDLA